MSASPDDIARQIAELEAALTLPLPAAARRSIEDGVWVVLEQKAR